MDFAVHATVCKHVHTVHHLRCTNASETAVGNSQFSIVDTAAEVTCNDVSAQSDVRHLTGH